ncbi:E3 ubiquitin-protein ligase RNF169 [Neodiprion pinetum]|uniref:E3 ubiquitin-protein ligase RNF169 n=1 Tax=Neodiprion pinetum TaxID=441929 RepID=UPI001EDFE86F|nr:uncharacterized protein LOC124219650 [Neodiprion pinetum]
MATYLKPTSKLFDLPSRASAELNLADLMCPVCRGILIEPVTLPCAHSLCLRCLNGTIQHNSLSCPLCRVRVGSWLRTATKSDTLVNGQLWTLIKTRFSKEIQAKHDGVDTDLDSGFGRTNKILSAAGEIRREYEAQLELAEEERRRLREAERIASEALIHKIQAEERQHITRLVKDRAVAKDLAKRHTGDKVKVREKHADEREAGCDREMQIAKSTATELTKLTERVEWNSNIALISKLRAERYASDGKAGMSNSHKCPADKFQSPKCDQLTSPTSKSTKHQVATKIRSLPAQSYVSKPSCSTSKIYGTQSKEELHVPSDVLNRKPKSLGVEVCLATGGDDQRIGSAESSCSHDSINIEIHHFKPIKAMPRTPLGVTPDGCPIDPKLIRVVATLQQVQNAIPKPPVAMELKRLSTWSYSAFKGKTKKMLKLEHRPTTSNVVKDEPESRPSTSHCPNQPQPNPSKLAKSQVSETVRRLDLSTEIPYDGNKNYAKNINRIINGTKVSKKLILDEDVALSMAHQKYDSPAKFKRRKHCSSSNDREETNTDQKTNNSGDEASSSNSSSNNSWSLPLDGPNEAVENIAERIKKRKMSRGVKSKLQKTEAPEKQRCTATEKKSATVRKPLTETTKSAAKQTTNARLGAQQKKGRCTRSEDEDTDSQVDSESVVETGAIYGSRKSTRTLTRSGGELKGEKTTTTKSHQESEMQCSDLEEEAGEEEDEDEEVQEQRRIERLLLQEKKDFELAQRLQAKFDEMERISGRTRGSRRSRFNSRNIEQVLAVDGVGIRDRFSKQLRIQGKETSMLENEKRRVTRRRCV